MVCGIDQPMQSVVQAISRASSAIPAATPMREVWPLLVLVLGGAALIRVRPRVAQSRGSPAQLQRFLF